MSVWREATRVSSSTRHADRLENVPFGSYRTVSYSLEVSYNGKYYG